MQLVAPQPTSAKRSVPQDTRTSQQRLATWTLLAAVGGFLLMAVPCLLGRVYVADDLGEFHLPLRSFYAQQLAAGESFDWMPGLYGGFHLTAEGQLGGYHPWHSLIYRWLPLGVAFDLELLASYPLLFGGMFVLLRYWLARRDAALFGALAFTFGSFNLLHFVHPNAVAIVAHIPWLLWAIELAITEPNRQRRAAAQLAVGLLTASQLLLGYPQYVWFSLLVEAAYAAWRTIAMRTPVARVAWLLFAAVCGVATAGVQLVPTFDGLAGSTRTMTDAAFADTGALHPLNLVQLVAPYLFATRVAGQNTHELGLYAGAVPLVLCARLFVNRRRWGRLAPLAWAVFVFGGFSLLLAFGQSGGLYRLQAWLPLVNHFRFPCRAVVLVQLCLAVGAATGLTLLLQSTTANNQTRRRRADRALAGAFLLSIVAAIAAPLVWPDYVASPLLVWCGPLLIGVAAALVALAERGVRWALAPLVLFTIADLCAYGLSYAIWPRTATLATFVADVELPAGKSDVRVAAAKTSAGLRTGNRMLLAGLKRVDGYAGLEPRKQLDYSTEPALRLAGAQYVWHPPRDSSSARGRWTEISSPAPRARLVTRTVGVDRLADLAALSLDDAAVDEPLHLPTATVGSVRIGDDRPGHIVVACTAPSRQLLVTTESFHPGWQARIDGRLEPVLRVNGDFLGCVVPEGTHEIALSFEPSSLRTGKYLSLCGLGLLLCTFLVRSRRPSSPQQG